MAILFHDRLTGFVFFLVVSSASESSTDPATKQRNLLNAKVLGHLRPSTPTITPSEVSSSSTAFQEVFVPPEVSIIAALLSKPSVDRSVDPPFVDYDSEESISSDEEDDVRSETEMDQISKRAETEHSDPNSFSWAILRLVIIKTASKIMQQVFTTVSAGMKSYSNWL